MNKLKQVRILGALQTIAGLTASPGRRRELWTDHAGKCSREKLEERKQNLSNALNDLAETEE